MKAEERQKPHAHVHANLSSKSVHKFGCITDWNTHSFHWASCCDCLPHGRASYPPSSCPVAADVARFEEDSSTLVAENKTNITSTMKLLLQISN